MLVQFGFCHLLVAGKGRHTAVKAVPGQVRGNRFFPGEQNKLIPADGPQPFRLLRRRRVKRDRSQRIDPLSRVPGVIRQTAGNQGAGNIVPRNDPVNAEISPRRIFLLLHVDSLLELTD